MEKLPARLVAAAADAQQGVEDRGQPGGCGNKVLCSLEKERLLTHLQTWFAHYAVIAEHKIRNKTQTKYVSIAIILQKFYSIYSNLLATEIGQLQASTTYTHLLVTGIC